MHGSCCNVFFRSTGLLLYSWLFLREAFPDSMARRAVNELELVLSQSRGPDTYNGSVKPCGIALFPEVLQYARTQTMRRK